jgi:hypothetical protein
MISSANWLASFGSQSWYWHLQLGVIPCSCLFSRLIFWVTWGTVLPLLLDTLGRSWLEGFFPAFLGLMGHLLQPGWLESSIWFLRPQGSLQLGPVIAHYWFVQGGPICCFRQVAAALPYICNSGWSAPPPVRWGDSVLCIALSPRRLAQQSATTPLGGCLISPAWLSAFLFLALPCLFSASWEFNSLLHPQSLRLVQCSTPPPTVSGW